ncbi:MAG: hypothetical protein ACK4QL_03765 [Pseudanabaenaceae cyanobacterium]
MSTAIEKVQKTKVLTSTAIAEHLIAEIQEVQKAIQFATQKANFYGRLCLFCNFGIGIFAFIAFWALQSVTNLALSSLFLRFVLFSLFLVLVFTILRIAFEILRRNYEDVIVTVPEYRCELAKYVLGVLGRDMDKYGMLDLCLKFKIDNSVVYTGLHPSKSGWRIDFYADDFLQVKGKLMDGTEFFIQFTERMREKKGKNINGKFRIKRVNKGMMISINLHTKESVYGNLLRFRKAYRHPDRNNQLIKIWQGGYLHSLKFKPNSLRLKVGLPQALPLRYTPTVAFGANTRVERQMEQLADVQKTFTSAMLSAYQVLNLARLLHQQAV